MRSIPLAPAALTLAGVLFILAAYWPTVWTLHELWSRLNEHYSHGYLLLALVGWLLWERREQLRALPVASAHWVLVFLIGASLTWLAADLVQAQFPQQVLMPALLWLWLTAAFGLAAGRALLVPVALIYFAMPVWEFLVDPLRQMTVVVTSAAISLIGIRAYIEGAYIHLAVGTFFVAGGCSGLSYLLTSILLSVVYGILYYRRLWQFVALLVAAVAVSLIANWIRVAGLVVIGHYTAMESSLIKEHGFYGWVIYAVLIFPFLWFAARLERPGDLEGDEASPAASVSTPAVRFPYLSLGLGAVCAVAGPLLALLVAAAPPGKAFEWPEATAWTLETHESDAAWRPRFKGYDLEAIGRYRRSGSEVQALALQWQVQEQGKELVSDMHRIARERDLEGQRVLQAAELPHAVLESRIGTARAPRLVWSWYVVGGQPTTSGLTAKLLQLQAFLQADRGARLMTLSTSCEINNCDAARQTLTDLLAALGPID